MTQVGSPSVTHADATPPQLGERADSAARRGRLRRLTREQVFAVVSPLALLIIWQILSTTGVIDRRVFSTPIDVAGDIWDLLLHGSLVSDMLITLRRLAMGMLVGAVPGALIGLAMGLARTTRAVINPIVATTYPLPRIALWPLVLLIVGLNETSVIIMVALGPFFAMLISTMTGVIEVPGIYRKVAKSYKMSRVRTYATVVLPAALPVMIGGLRIAFAEGLLSVIAVEFLTANNGLGYMIWHSWQILSLSESMAGMIAAGLLGAGLYTAVTRVEKLALPYKYAGARRL